MHKVEEVVVLFPGHSGRAVGLVSRVGGFVMVGDGVHHADVEGEVPQLVAAHAVQMKVDGNFNLVHGPQGGH